MYLGNFSQTLLVFGGPYSNLPSVIALKDRADRLGIKPDHIICTGDIVAYCGQPVETVDFIRQWGIHVLMGNCEESFATDAEDCGCGFDEGSSCDVLSAQWFTFANKALDKDHRNWFSRLPRTLNLDFNGKKIQVVHGSIRRINEFLFPSSAEISFREQLQLSDADIILAGHCGIPFSKKIDRRLWHNSGAVGMPANDGTHRTWFSLISFANNQIMIDCEALEYDYADAQNAMVKAGLNNGYAAALSSGLWPSMDVLPEGEKRKRGLALNPTTTIF